MTSGTEVRLTSAAGNTTSARIVIPRVDVQLTREDPDFRIATTAASFDYMDAFEGSFPTTNPSTGSVLQSKSLTQCAGLPTCVASFPMNYTSGSSFLIGVTQRGLVQHAVYRRLTGGPDPTTQEPGPAAAAKLRYDASTGLLSSDIAMPGGSTVRVEAPNNAVRGTRIVTLEAGTRLQLLLTGSDGLPIAHPGDTITVSGSAQASMRVAPPTIRFDDQNAGIASVGRPDGAAPGDGRLLAADGSVLTPAGNGRVANFATAVFADHRPTALWEDTTGNTTSASAELWRFRATIAPRPAALSVIGGRFGATDVTVTRNGAVVASADLARVDTNVIAASDLPATLLPGDIIEITGDGGTARGTIPAAGSVLDIARDRVFVAAPVGVRARTVTRNYADVFSTTVPASGEFVVQYGVAGRRPTDLRAAEDVTVELTSGWHTSVTVPILPDLRIDLGTRAATWGWLPTGEYRASIVCGTTIDTVPFTAVARTTSRIDGTGFPRLALDPGCAALTRTAAGADLAAPVAPLLDGTIAANRTAITIDATDGRAITVTAGSFSQTFTSPPGGVRTITIPAHVRGLPVTLRMVDAGATTWTRTVAPPAAPAPQPTPDPNSDPNPGTTPTPGTPGTVPDPSTPQPNPPTPADPGSNTKPDAKPDTAPPPVVPQPVTPPRDTRTTTTPIPAEGATIARDGGMSVTTPANAFTGAVLQVAPSDKPQDTVAAKKAFTRGFTAGSSFVNVTIHDAGELAGELDVHDLAVPIRIAVPIAAKDRTPDAQLAPAWFADGQWKLSPKIKAGVLPRELPDGYWIERKPDGSRLVVFLTRHLTEFGVLRDTVAPRWSGKAAKATVVAGSGKLLVRWRAATDGTGIRGYRILLDGKPVAKRTARQGRTVSLTAATTRAHRICIDAFDGYTNAARTCVSTRVGR